MSKIKEENIMNYEIAVSVIVPVYNVEKYLSRCIDSILNQTLKNIEIILIDDGSIDESLSICREYEQHNDNIMVFHQENMGLTAVRRKGLSLAKGEYTIFVDSDDYILENTCEEMYTYCKENNLKLLIADYFLIKDNACKIIKGFLGNEFSIKNFYESISPGYVWNKMYHNSLFERMKVNINVNQAEDICMMLPLLSTLKDNEVGYVSKPFYFYSVRNDSNSNSKLFAQNGSIEEYLHAISYILKNHNIQYRNYIVYYCVQCMYWGITNPDKIEFKADYIDFLQKELSSYIIGNPLLIKFSKLGNDLVESIIPANIYFVNYSDDINTTLDEKFINKFKNYRIQIININNNVINEYPACVKKAIKNGNINFVKDFLAVKEIYLNGGIFVSSNMKVIKSFGEVRVNRAFVGYRNDDEIGMDIWGSIKNDTFITKLYDSYFEDSIFNEKEINLTIRSNIILQKYFKLILKGKECFLMTNQIKIYASDKLYIRRNSKYVSYYYNELDELAEKQGKVLLDYNVFQNIIEAKDIKEKDRDEFIRIDQLEKEVLTYKSMYETVLNSTCWKITKPIRLFFDFIRKK
jgi:glycosyltransferase involved in cell wall biosynthesis